MGDRSSLKILWGKMEDQLEELCKETVGVLGYSLLDIDEKRKISFNGDVLFPTASTIKIPVLLGLALKVGEGLLSWETRIPLDDEIKVGGSGILGHLKYPVDLSLWDMASLMIALSDNTATNVCINLAGMDYINQFLSQLGLHKTRVKRLMMDYDAPKRGDENVSTPDELVELMRRLEAADGIPREVCSDVLKILELPKGGAFQEGLPEYVRRANKPGGLGNLSVDAGLIYLSNKTFSLAVMGGFLEGRPSTSTASLVRTAYRYMDLLDKCTELGRS